MSDDLREALAKIKPGDEVIVAVEFKGHTGTLSGEVYPDGEWLCIADQTIRYSNGDRGPFVTAVLDHKPHVPEVTAEVLDALPVWSVVTTRNGVAWPKYENGLWGGVWNSVRLAGLAPLTIRHPRDGAA